MAQREPGREALWRELERELRRFVRLFDEQPEWLWEAETVKLVRAVRPRLELLDGAGRVGRALPAVKAPGGGARAGTLDSNREGAIASLTAPSLALRAGSVDGMRQAPKPHRAH